MSRISNSVVQSFNLQDE